ncbi:MAG: hypothetical protein LBM71_04405 [Elusimicrobiota bacterium]|jgi:hypothetical protein|nr:hypothetical protein [Elusimicrobiota bacterium]
MKRLDKVAAGDYKISKEFFSPSYLTAQAITIIIFMLGFKWTLFGLYWIPFILNPFIYGALVLCWLYYNFLWIRTALYIPSSAILVRRTYLSIGVKISWAKAFYIAISKITRIRKEYSKVKKINRFIKMLALVFVKSGIILNFPRWRAQEISKALFIHKKRKVMAFFKATTPYITPVFLAMLILTPLIAFLSDYNYRYMIENFVNEPMLKVFSVYIIVLPFRLVWIFLMLNTLATNIIGPLISLPCADLYGPFLKENNEPIDLKRRQTPTIEGLIALLMIIVATAFYSSVAPWNLLF